MPWKPHELIYLLTFHVTPVDLCIIFQCNLYNLYLVSCLVEIKLFYCFKLFQIVSSQMNLYGPTLHASPIDLCILFLSKVNKYCIMSYGNKLVNWNKTRQTEVDLRPALLACGEVHTLQKILYINFIYIYSHTIYYFYE